MPVIKLPKRNTPRTLIPDSDEDVHYYVDGLAREVVDRICPGDQARYDYLVDCLRADLLVLASDYIAAEKRGRNTPSAPGTLVLKIPYEEVDIDSLDCDWRMYFDKE